MLLGIGASAIGSLCQGYVQNHVRIDDYRRALQADRLPVARGLALDDRMRADRAVIEAIMCDGEVDIAEKARQFGLPAKLLEPEAERMRELEALGIAHREGTRVRVAAECRPLLRVAAAAFDRFLASGGARHSAAL